MQRLILCGGGHVSLELAYIASRLAFQICVIDDRPEFADPVRFPMAEQVLALPYDEGLRQLGSQPDDFCCVLTRSPVFDQACLETILRGEFAFAGMIGSRRKIGAVMAALEKQGFSPEQLTRIHAPIGLLLGGETPAEVAVEIAAQLVQERAKLGPALTPPPTEPGILCTITAKSGSAPRSPGTWMLVRPDGTTAGTVGGGSVEFHALQDAKALWENGAGSAEHTYDVGDNKGPENAFHGRVTIRFVKQ